MNKNYPFTKIDVVPKLPIGDYIFWELDPTFTNPAPFKFVIEASEIENFSEILKITVASNEFYGIDTSNQRQIQSKSYYYRVKLETGSGKVFYSPIASINRYPAEAHRYWMAKDIIRREYVRFRFTGIAGYLLKRKNYGEIVKSTVSKISNLPMVEDSPIYGTRFSGGYYKPFPLMFSIDQSQQMNKSNDSGFGVDEHETLKIRTVGFPIVNSKDILVFRNSRYNIENVQFVNFPGTTITLIQSFEAKLLPPTDPVYKIEVENI